MSRPSRALAFGGLSSGVFVALALLSLLWTPYDPTQISIIERLQPIGAQHWLGTDQLGRDVLSMLMRGAATSLGVAVAAVVLGAVPGIALGLYAAAKRGWIDEIVMRGNDVVFAFPALLVAILLTTAFGPGALNAILAIGLFNVPVFARVTRAGALRLWPREYILAARVAGKDALRISLEHLLPNLGGALMVQATTQFALAIVAESALAYLGLGTQAPLPSWGRMLAEAQTLTALAPGLAIYPGLAVVLSVLGLNWLGNGLRDLLDPRLARGV